MSRRMYVDAALLMLCCPTLSLAQSVAAPAPQPLTIDGAVTLAALLLIGAILWLRVDASKEVQ